ncbi:tyrosine-protein phosphatase [Flindersiella endophytica]
MPVSVVYEPAWIDWPVCVNARDLGGLPTASGGVIRRGALVRTDDLRHLTAAGKAAVTAYGVRRVVDLRNVEELERWPNPFAGDASMYAHRAVAPTQQAPIEDLAADYVRMVDIHAELFASAVAAIASAPAGGVAVHCSGGKDRTGVVTALALAVAGVDEAYQLADYLATGDRLHLINERNFPKNDPRGLARAERLHGRMDAAVLTGVLTHLRRKYGGAEGYLRHGGLGAADLDALRARLVQPG